MKVVWKLGRLREAGLSESSLKYTDFVSKKAKWNGWESYTEKQNVPQFCMTPNTSHGEEVLSMEGRKHIPKIVLLMLAF